MREKVSPDGSELVSDQEIKESIEWMNGKSSIQIAVEMARLRKEAVLGRIDLLTGLKNRRGLEESLEYFMPLAVRQRMEIVITALDLDNLKEINDKKGHEEGDKLLVDATKKILSSIRKSDVAARVGGDEFLIVSLIKGKEDVEKIKEKLRKNLSGIEISIGSSLWLTGESLKDAIAKADNMMYEDKKERKENG